jgi:hypothetical protein
LCDLRQLYTLLLKICAQKWISHDLAPNKFVIHFESIFKADRSGTIPTSRMRLTDPVVAASTLYAVLRV